MDQSLDRERCYRAVLSRDDRFDGRFYTGVVTTGIYCRPICPARPPKLANARFFPSSSAAEREGFRPCRRCRPETSPGTPAWLGTSATVSRALRLIGDGALDGRGGVDEIASRLGVGARHLRRLFDEHLGASPIAVALTRRIHFARKLIDDTDLSMTEIAYASGFSSLRRFNDAFAGAFDLPPSALRKKPGPHGPDAPGECLVLRLPYRRPYDWDAMISFLGARAIPGIEAADRRAYRRSCSSDGGDGWIEVSPDPGKAHLLLRIAAPATSDLIRIAERARRLFDLGADPFRIGSHLRRDPRLRAAVRARPGLRVPGAWDPFELAVRAILGQQVTVKGATTLAARLVRAYGRPVRGIAAPGITHIFPTPHALAEADLTGIGLPRARAAAIRSLAAAVHEGALTLDASDGLTSALARLRGIPGVGAWTAQYIAMRAFGEPDVLPAGDLGLRRALATGRTLPTLVQVEARAASWQPWRSYAVLHLWLEATRPTGSQLVRRGSIR